MTTGNRWGHASITEEEIRTWKADAETDDGYDERIIVLCDELLSILSMSEGEVTTRLFGPGRFPMPRPLSGERRAHSGENTTTSAIAPPPGPYC